MRFSPIINDLIRCHYVHLPMLYMKWFRLRLLTHPLSQMKDPLERLIIQTLRGIHDTEDAGHERYKLLALLLTNDLGMVPSTTNKGLFYWNYQDHTAYLTLTTDELLHLVPYYSIFSRILLMCIFHAPLCKDLHYTFKIIG